MPRKQKKYHFIYRTTNLLNGKFYVGMHSTDDLEDGYVGSGKILGYSIRKYGLENHKCEILECFSSRDELKKREVEIVNEELLADPLCMNLKFGGTGGWDHISSEMKSNAAKSSNRSISKILASSKRRATWNKEQHACGKIRYDNFSGKTHSDETKRKMSLVASNRTGSKNSQFGSCWIFNETSLESIKIRKEDLEDWINKGWKLGRKIKRIQP